MTLDLVIAGAALLDGLGTPPRPVDVGIAAGRVAELGDLSGQPARSRLDATGRIVAPGFVDIHSHSDLSVLSDGRARSKLAQGVTTEVVGNCGLGPFPTPPATTRRVREAMALIDVDPAIHWDFTDLDAYRRAVEQARPALNIAALAGHIPLRLAADRHAVGPLDAAGRDRLAGLLDDALEAGAVGCSTGLMYPPALDADAAELAAIGRTVARRGRLFAVHARNYSDRLVDAVDEALAVARQTGCRLQVSHLAVAGRAHWGSVARALERVDRARESGVDVMLDIYPYLAGSANLSQLLPTWAQAGGTDQLVARLREPAERERIRREWDQSMFLGWDEIEISSVDADLGDVLGLSVATIGQRWGVDAAVAALDLIVATSNRVTMVAYGRSERDLLDALSHPAAMIGSDGLSLDPDGASGAGRPHPRSYGCYPRLLGRLVREGSLTLQRAVAMSTSMPADRVGLTDRGRVAVGAMADLVVFDPDTIIDRATFADPGQFPDGIDAIVVAGVLTPRPGRCDDPSPGEPDRAGAFLVPTGSAP